MVEFSPIPEEHRRGVVREYLVHYMSIGNAKDSDNVTSPGNMTRVELKGLLKFTNYSIMVTAFTVGYGNFSAPIVVSSAEDGE